MIFTVELDIQGDASELDTAALVDRIFEAIERQRRNEGLTGDDEPAYVRGVGVSYDDERQTP